MNQRLMRGVVEVMAAVLLGAGVAPGQTLPASGPGATTGAAATTGAGATTGPAATTQTVERWQLTLPPGFERVQAGGYTLLCAPQDKAMVLEAMNTFTPATGPTTMPAELLARLEQNREAVLKAMGQDFAIKDISAVRERLGTELDGELKKLNDFHPPVFYLVTTEARLKQVLRGDGWKCPGLYYNPLADTLVPTTRIRMTTERPMDDAVLPVLLAADEDAGKRGERVRNAVRESQREIQEMVSGRAMFVTQVSFVEVVMKEVFASLKLPLDQDWLGIGLAGVTSADYAQSIIGSEKKELLLLLAAELRQNPLKIRSIDLLHPVEPGALRKQYVAAYADAFRRKSMRAVIKMLKGDGRSKLPALITSLREKPCVSGQELVARIRSVVGVDLTGDLGAQ